MPYFFLGIIQKKKGKRMKKQRIFFDMDGTLAKWLTDKSIKEISSKGYFATLPEIENMVALVEYVLSQQQMDVYILSCILSDQTKREKNIWLDYYLPEIDENHRLFVPHGESKTKWLKILDGALYKEDVLIDDFSKNLFEWHGIAIKVMNGINGTKGKWQKHKISAFEDPKINYKKIQEIGGKEHVKNRKKKAV